MKTSDRQRIRSVSAHMTDLIEKIDSQVSQVHNLRERAAISEESRDHMLGELHIAMERIASVRSTCNELIPVIKINQPEYVITCYVEHETEFPIAIRKSAPAAKQYAQKMTAERPTTESGDKLFYKVYPIEDYEQAHSEQSKA